MSPTPEHVVGHVDMDAFFAAVEQRDKPSLRGRPVVVGGVGPRGVVATASYEARAFGVRSAMPMAEARRRCPAAAVLTGRFEAYRASSERVMLVLAKHSPAVEQVSLDEAYVHLPGTGIDRAVGRLRAEVADQTGLTASVGVGSSKLVAKIASDDAKPDGSLVVRSDEQELLDALAVRRLPGLGPQTESRLSRLGVSTVRHLRSLDLVELTGLVGDAHGTLLWRLARGIDDRPIQPVHETKSVSVEETFDTDLTDPVMVDTVLTRMAGQLSRRLRHEGVSGRTVTLKARYPDFTTINRSATSTGPTDDARAIARMARSLASDVDLPRGVRLLGVGCSALTTWVQDDLFVDDEEPADQDEESPLGNEPSPRSSERPRRWFAGADVVHDEYGAGWVWGSGIGRVTVRFETRHSAPGPVLTFAQDDPRLHRGAPEPLTPET